MIYVRNCRALVLVAEKNDPHFCLDRLFQVNEGDQNVTCSIQLLHMVNRSRCFPPTGCFTSTHAGPGSSQVSMFLALLIKPPTLHQVGVAGVIGLTRPDSSLVATTFRLYIISPGSIGTSDTTAKKHYILLSFTKLFSAFKLLYLYH